MNEEHHETEPIIELRSISKNYDNFTALKDISLKIEKGTIFGLLGPNGAGKSTVIRILSCQSRPSSGSAYVSGLDTVIDRHEVLSIIGVAPQEHSFYDELTVNENLIYFGSLYGIPLIDIKRRSNKLLDMLNLQEKKHSKAATLSGGMKTRLNIACALVHRPLVLILDEPSAGLDPLSRNALWDTIRAVNKEGATILITTHNMEEADILCGRIVIMNRGKVVVEGRQDDLKNMVGKKVITIASVPGSYRNLLSRIQQLKGVLSCGIDGKGLKITLNNGEIQEILEIFESSGEGIKNVESSRPSLEDVFIHATGEMWH